MADVIDKIDKEIEDLATKMNKSAKSPKELLAETILELGPEGLKKAYSKMKPEEQKLLEEVLEEMKKAANTPKPTEDAEKLTPKETETKNSKLRTVEQTGSDDQDEKLMETKNAEHNPQGGPKDSPLEGQVIKGREPGSEHKTASGAVIIGHTSTGKPMYANAEHPAHVEHSHEDHKEHAGKHEGLAQDVRMNMKPGTPEHGEIYGQARFHEKQAAKHRKMAGDKEDKLMEKNYGSGMMKAYDNFMSKAKQETKELRKKQGVPEGVDPAKWERGVKEVKNKPGIDNPYAVINAAMAKGADVKKELTPEEKAAKQELKKSKKIAKSLKKIVSMAKSLKMTKEQVVKSIKDSNNNLKVVKAEMKLRLAKGEGMDSFKPNPEVDQVKPSAQDKKHAGDFEPKIPTEEGELKIEAPKTADEATKELPKVAKSVNWNMKNSIGANTLGRNVHYQVGEEIIKAEKERDETVKNGTYIGEKKPSEDLKKSEGKKLDINDVIEKGLDFGSAEVIRREGIKSYKKDETIKLQKSFADEDIRLALGMDEKTYKELMGE